MADFNTAQLEYMLSKGLTLADAIEIAKLGKKRSSNAERQARWRARQRGESVTNNVTDNVTDNALPPPIDNNHTPPVSSNDETTRLPKRAVSPAKPEDVSDQVWGDFLRHRKAKKAPVSDTVIAGLRREAAKAGWTLEAALSECVVRGWQAFKSEWVEAAKPQKTAQNDDFLAHLQRRKRAEGVPSG